MSVAWIQQFYNDTQLTFWLRSVDGMNNGNVGGILLDDGNWHAFPGPLQYQADWCGIPWVDRGHRYKDLSSHPDTHILRFWTDGDAIVFVDGNSGQQVANLQIVDFGSMDVDIALSITAGGIYFDSAAAYGPSYCYVFNSNGDRAIVGRDELARVLGNVAGGTINLGQEHRMHGHARTGDEAAVSAQEETKTASSNEQEQRSGTN